MNTSRGVLSIALIGIVLVCGAWSPREECSGRETAPAWLLIINETECPVEVWMDDEPVCVCEPFMSYRVGCLRSGGVTLVGRSRCDTWGPVVKTLRAGGTTVWRVGRVGN